LNNSDVQWKGKSRVSDLYHDVELSDLDAKVAEICVSQIHASTITVMRMTLLKV
jgi:hypothetical protein